ncbi:MAG: S-layer homology domain-containing protein [Clostridia bacterium]|nr:S-layer homology domain-containing protein [Clostridia bacterium]
MKKNLKKLLAVLLAAAMTLSMCLTAVASVFPDVTDENYPWAIDAIEAMAEEGIIKGYDDGTFNPAKTVSKLESLVLISRILGFNDDINSGLVSAAWDKYGEEISKYDLNYGQDEIAYLLIKGVLLEEELEEYIDELHRNDGLKRYEVAVLLTKALDAVKLLSNDDVSNLAYEDNADIPASAKKHVAYISKIGLMQGLENNTFAPNDTVTRAQAALVLYKLQDMTSYVYEKGIVSGVDQKTRTIKLQCNDGETVSLTASSGTIMRYNGESIIINDIEVGLEAVVTYKDESVYAIDFTDALIDEIVYGAFVSSAKSTVNGTTIIVNELGEFDTDVDKTKKTTYKVSEDAIITYNDTTCSLTSLKAGYYLKLTVEKGVVTVIDAKASASKISGRVNKVILEPVYMLSIEDKDGVIKDYLVSSTVTVKKNATTATARDILEGDSVSLGLSYDRITDISAMSKTTNKSGIIKEVVISSTPRITISYDGNDISYAITNSASIKVGDNAATFYDLRVGMSVKYTLESDTIVSLQTTANSTVTTWEGTVVLVNASYDLIQITFVDSVTGATRNESVFVKKNASIVDYATQKDKKLSAIKPGAKVSVTGSLVSGIFEAGTVVIIG